jgi:hypothetical protein
MRIEDLAYGAPKSGEGVWPAPQQSVANAVNTLLVPAVATAATGGKIQKSHLVIGVTLSVSAATAAESTFTISDGIVLEQIDIPVGFVGPLVINYTRPLYFRPGNAVTLNWTAAGAAIKTTIAVRGISRTDS